MQEQLERDLKAALLSGDKHKAEVLKGIKNSLQYETVALGARETGLNLEQIQKVLSRESKKRGEAAEVYKSVGETERANAELLEKEIIDSYLPKQASEQEIKTVVTQEMGKFDNPTNADMGKIIGAVRARLGATADGGTISRLVKESLGK